MPSVTLRLRGAFRKLLLAGFTVGFVTTIPISAAAAGPVADPSSELVDQLWNQPQGVRVDSCLYIIQSWWDGLTAGNPSDPTQRGMAQLAQANTDLLNAYTLLVERRTNPGPTPVPVIDPIISSVYGVITGIHPKAPLGSVFRWINQVLLHLEGRGSSDEIIQSLLRDHRARQAAAANDLPATDPVWTANWDRQAAMLQKIHAYDPHVDGISDLLAEIAADHAAGRPVAQGKVSVPGSKVGSLTRDADHSQEAKKH